MRPVLLLLSLACGTPALLHAEPIEVPAYPKVMDPFSGKLLERFRAGSPPSYMGSHETNMGAVSGKPAYWFGETRGFGIMMSPSFSVLRWSGAEPTLVQPDFSPTEGLYILRDDKGRVAQAWSDVGVTVFEYLPAGWKEIHWDMEDTEYGGAIPGGRKPIEGRKALVIFEVRELKRDLASGVVEILDIRLHREQPPQVSKVTYRNGPKRAMMSSETYLAAEIDPDKLSYRRSYQRIYWAEGPGLIEIKTEQQKNEKGEFVPTLDLEEHWKVSETGVRTLDSRVDKLRPQK